MTSPFKAEDPVDQVPLYLAAMSFQEVVHTRLRRRGEGGGGNGRAGQPALTLLAARTSGTTLAARGNVELGDMLDRCCGLETRSVEPAATNNWNWQPPSSSR